LSHSQLWPTRLAALALASAPDWPWVRCLAAPGAAGAAGVGVWVGEAVGVAAASSSTTTSSTETATAVDVAMGTDGLTTRAEAARAEPIDIAAKVAVEDKAVGVAQQTGLAAVEDRAPGVAAAAEERAPDVAARIVLAVQAAVPDAAAADAAGQTGLGREVAEAEATGLTRVVLDGAAPDAAEPDGAERIARPPAVRGAEAPIAWLRDEAVLREVELTVQRREAAPIECAAAAVERGAEAAALIECAAAEAAEPGAEAPIECAVEEAAELDAEEAAVPGAAVAAADAAGSSPNYTSHRIRRGRLVWLDGPSVRFEEGVRR
jgi:hypothetical protein